MISYPYDNKKADIVVVEVSSFQLDTASYFKPDVAVLLNISEDHLDRYDSYKAYIDSKWSIFRDQSENNTAIIQKNIHDGDARIKRIKSAVICFNADKNDNEKQLLSKAVHSDNAGRKNNTDCDYGTAFISCNNLIIHHKNRSISLNLSQSPLKGDHNRENLAAAATASFVAGATFQGIEYVFRHFKGLDHRIQYTANINGIAFYNDSKATNTDAVARAIECFDDNIILIMGGKEKNTDFSSLKKNIEKKVKKIIAIGQTRYKIKDIFGKISPVLCVNTMEEAVKNGIPKFFQRGYSTFVPGLCQL